MRGQLLDRKSVQKSGENVDKIKDQEVRRMFNGRLLQCLRHYGRLLQPPPGLGKAEDDFRPKK